jgi:predicted DsbA family dithiol-disulfide isomerase
MRPLTLALVVLLTACRSAAPSTSTSTATATAATPEPRTVLARVDGEEILAADVDESIRGGLIRADAEHQQSVHQLRSEALSDLIDARLVARQARKEGVTEDALIAREVTAKVSAPTEGELHAVYDRAREEGQELPPFDDVRPEVVRFVTQSRMRAALDEFHGRLRAAAKVENLMPPLLLPKVPVEAVGPSLGATDAPVTIVAFSDYECPFCKRAEPAVKSVLESYAGKVRLVYREFPLPNHRHAQKASEAALCAHDQGKYWQMQEKLFANQSALAVEDLKTYARGVGLDSERFDRCLDAGDKRGDIEKSIRAGDAAGVSGTPAFFINGRPLSGAASIERFKEIIDAELASAGTKTTQESR